jgi:hypothetical protein
MTSVEEAAAFFQRHGFRAMAALERSCLVVGIPGNFESDAELSILPRCWGKQILTPDGTGWMATAVLGPEHDGPLQRHRFDSLADAVNDVLARLQHCLRTDTSLDRT